MAISQGRFRVVEMDKDGSGGEGYTVVVFELLNHKGEPLGQLVITPAIDNEEAFDTFEVHWTKQTTTSALNEARHSILKGRKGE